MTTPPANQPLNVPQSESIQTRPPRRWASGLDVFWKKLQKEPMVFLATGILVLLYLMIGLAGFLAPYSEVWKDRKLANASPTPIYNVDEKTGHWVWPYVYEQKLVFDAKAYTNTTRLVRGKTYPIELFVEGEPYTLLGIIPANIHLFGVQGPGHINLLGTDVNGRDTFSRLLYGGQISLTIGFISLLISIPIGLLYGGISGYFGGWLDTLLMRFAEIIMCIPSLYLLITLATILPPEATSEERFLMVTIILALIGWAGFARVIRGMVLSIKNQEFVEAERALGIGTLPLIVKHILPQTASYVIVALTIGVPSYILAESSLSFLGLGILQPDASWGNMLKEAQEITNILYRPWMLAPAFMIFMAVLAFNVIGDAVRDILDPKSYVPGRRKAQKA